MEEKKISQLIIEKKSIIKKKKLLIDFWLDHHFSSKLLLSTDGQKSLSFLMVIKILKSPQVPYFPLLWNSDFPPIKYGFLRFTTLVILKNWAAEAKVQNYLRNTGFFVISRASHATVIQSHKSALVCEHSHIKFLLNWKNKASTTFAKRNENFMN